MSKADYLLIVNPTAGRSRTGRLLPSLETALKAEGVKYEFRFTSMPGEGTKLAKAAIAEGFPYIVAVGGDGTAHEVVNGIVGSSSIFGMIPTGGGNDFPKAANIPLDYTEAVKNLVRGKRRRVDVGFLEGRYFINGLGIGLDGAVSHRYRKMKYLRGKPGYLWGAVQEAIGFKGFPVEVKIPDWEFKGVVLLTGASNGPSQGGDFKLAPNAKVDDGFLDIHVIQDMPPLRRLVEIPKVLKANHLGLKEVAIKQTPWMELTLDQTMPAHLDGEPFYLDAGKHRVEVVPKALEIISAL